MASTHETVATLRDLMHACREGVEGYRTAAERVEDEELRSRFARTADERERFLGELEQEVRRLGEDPREMPTLGDALESTWSGIRDAFSPNDGETVLATCQRADESTAESYRTALAAPLPEPIHAIVERQYHALSATGGR